MNTYNSYQEAKIANPEYAIFEYLGNFGTDKDIIDTFDIYSVAMKECSPADYCMTVEQFLKDGYKFVEGDLIQKGRFVTEVGDHYTVGISNELFPSDGEYYILRAAALEQPKREVEWKNGDECRHEEHGDCELVFIGMSATEPLSKCHVEYFDGEYVSSYYLPVDELSKPKSERELVIEQVESALSELMEDDWSLACVASKLYDLGMLKPIQEG